MDGSTFVWLVVLGILDGVAVFMIMKYGIRHGEPTPRKPEDSPAVAELRRVNAERLAKIEAARARTALQSGEPSSS